MITVELVLNSETQVEEELLTLVKDCCAGALSTEGLSGKFQVSLTLTDGEGIRELNNQFRGIDSATDVLSFPMSDSGDYPEDLSTGALLLGDIVINLDRARTQAEEYGHSFNREVGFLSVHSMFHLLGYDHVDDEVGAKLMRSKEEATLTTLGLTRD